MQKGGKGREWVQKDAKELQMTQKGMKGYENKDKYPQRCYFLNLVRTLIRFSINPSL